MMLYQFSLCLLQIISSGRGGEGGSNDSIFNEGVLTADNLIAKRYNSKNKDSLIKNKDILRGGGRGYVAII